MDLKGVHVLFCDHDPSTGSETVALLQKCSYKVTAVKSARKVVEALNAEDSDVDIVLTDMELPQEKGFKMLKHILSQENLSHVAVVVMSVRDDMAVVAKCLRLGAVDFLVKPLRANEVMKLWTHMWRRRRTLGLPDKHAAIQSTSFTTNVSKPDATADFLSCYFRKDLTPTIDAHIANDSRDCTAAQPELSLRLSLNYSAETLPKQDVNAGAASMPASPVSDRVIHSSAFSVYVKSNNEQPDELSATNVCSPCSQSSKRHKRSANRESARRVPSMANASQDSPKDTSVADENRPVDMESQNCDISQLPPVQCMVSEERLPHTGQMPSAHPQGFQPSYTYVKPTPDMRQGFSGGLQEGCTAGYLNPTQHSSHVNVQHLPPYHNEAGMINVQSVPNTYSYYPLGHLAVPVVSFSTWPPMVPSPPSIVGGKLIHAERREAALSKFRMKRKGRCFEKKIRYASRKKLAEQRPRVRGQFVKRTAVAGLAESAAIQGGFDDEEEGEADDEQGCSELDNHSSPECLAENIRDG